MTEREQITIKNKIYNKKKYLGEGGFAEVFQATCFDEAGDLAIKIISKFKNEKGERKGKKKNDGRWWEKHEQFVRKEIEIHQRLQHSNIVKLYDDFEDAKAVYLILEFCSKGSLDAYIKNLKGRLEEKKVYKIFKQIVEGVQYLHNRGVIHRDLTLRNILLTEDMQVKIADFGLSTHSNEAEDKNLTICGTPNFMPPEMKEGKGYGEKVDCWNLGKILYALIIGEIPKCEDENEMNFKLRSENISPQAKELLHKLLEKDPTKRICIDAVPNSDFFKKYEKNSSYSSKGSGNGSRKYLSSPIEKKSHLKSHDSGFNSKNSSSKKGKSSSKKYHSEEILAERRNFDLPKDKLLPSRNNFFINDLTHDRKRSASEDRKPYKPLSYDNPRQVYNSRERSVSAERERNENFKLSCRHGYVNDACRNISSGYNRSQERYKSNDSGINSVWKTCPEQRICVDPTSCRFSNTLLEDPHQFSASSCSHPGCLPNINNPEKLNERSFEQLTPLNAARLRPKRYMPNGFDTVLHISADNQVIIEVLKRKKYVSEVFIISTDGKEIKIYEPAKKTHLDYDHPAPFPNDSKEIKSYDFQKLPKMYHKRYLVAKQFVDILRSKKPKFINNGKNARFYVMENSDMKMEFYNGGSVVKKDQIITITDKLGSVCVVYDVNRKLDQNFKSMLEEFLNEKEDCEIILDFFMKLRSPNFPIVMGETKNDIISTRQKIGKENFAPSSKNNRRNGDR